MFHDSQRVVDVVGFSWTFLEGKVQTSWCATWSSHWDTRLQWLEWRTYIQIQCNTTCALIQLGIISQDMYINNFTNFTVDSCIDVDPPTGRQALLCQYRLIIWCHKCQIKHAVSSLTTEWFAFSWCTAWLRKGMTSGDTVTFPRMAEDIPTRILQR